MIEEYLGSQLLISAVVLITQIIFIYLRSLNVIYTAEKRLLPAMITAVGIAFSWLISMSLGITSFMNGNWLVITSFVIGGVFGTYL